jgi:hypothetical protein
VRGRERSHALKGLVVWLYLLEVEKEWPNVLGGSCKIPLKPKWVPFAPPTSELDAPP